MTRKNREVGRAGDREVERPGDREVERSGEGGLSFALTPSDCNGTTLRQVERTKPNDEPTTRVMPMQEFRLSFPRHRESNLRLNMWSRRMGSRLHGNDTPSEP